MPKHRKKSGNGVWWPGFWLSLIVLVCILAGVFLAVLFSALAWEQNRDHHPHLSSSPSCDDNNWCTKDKKDEDGTCENKPLSDTYECPQSACCAEISQEDKGDGAHNFCDIENGEASCQCFECAGDCASAHDCPVHAFLGVNSTIGPFQNPQTDCDNKVCTYELNLETEVGEDGTDFSADQTTEPCTSTSAHFIKMCMDFIDPNDLAFKENCLTVVPECDEYSNGDGGFSGVNLRKCHYEYSCATAVANPVQVA